MYLKLLSHLVHNYWKKRDREIEVKIDWVAKKSCLDAIELEHKLCSFNISGVF